MDNNEIVGLFVASLLSMHCVILLYDSDGSSLLVNKQLGFLTSLSNTNIQKTTLPIGLVNCWIGYLYDKKPYYSDKTKREVVLQILIHIQAQAIIDRD